ncbi:MAG TPA: hypothetical protein VGG06_08085 [Thermoanaerobaculia bacterium]
MAGQRARAAQLRGAHDDHGAGRGDQPQRLAGPDARRRDRELPQPAPGRRVQVVARRPRRLREALHRAQAATVRLQRQARRQGPRPRAQPPLPQAPRLRHRDPAPGGRGRRVRRARVRRMSVLEGADHAAATVHATRERPPDHEASLAAWRR